MNTIAFSVGQRVERADNPRHVGTVIAVLWSHIIRVKWDNGWREDVDAGEITRSNGDER